MTGRIHCKGQNQRKKRQRKIEQERVKTRMERLLAAIRKALTGK